MRDSFACVVALGAQSGVDAIHVLRSDGEFGESSHPGTKSTYSSTRWEWKSSVIAAAALVFARFGTRIWLRGQLEEEV